MELRARMASVVFFALSIAGCAAPPAPATSAAARDGSAVAGDPAGRYVPAKTAPGLFGKRWKLVELMGQPIAVAESAPYIELTEKDKRITGFGGCNNFSGDYTLDESASRLRFAPLATTMKMCLSGMDVEKTFYDVLNRTDGYSLDGDHLLLVRARMAPLARLEAVSP